MQQMPKQNGFSLIEMLLAVLILSLGMLGIAGLQTVGLRNNNNAYLRTQANLLAYDIVDSMRANRDAALGDDYDMTLGGTVPTADAIATADLTAWAANLAAVLPSGQGAVDCDDTTDVCVITVNWVEVGTGGAATSFFLSTEI